jgi:hypothetical protein
VVEGPATHVTKPPANRRKPALLVDIDGVISLWGFASNSGPEGIWLTVDGIVHFLSAAAGRHLLALTDTFEPAWCSGWEEKANDYLPEALGLPHPLPHITFNVKNTERHWKLDAIDAWAGPDRPLAWIDDDLGERCRSWARERRGPTVLVETEPATGLTQAHVDRLRRWAAALPAAAPDPW